MAPPCSAWEPPLWAPSCAPPHLISISLASRSVAWQRQMAGRKRSTAATQRQMGGGKGNNRSVAWAREWWRSSGLRCGGRQWLGGKQREPWVVALRDCGSVAALVVSGCEPTAADREWWGKTVNRQRQWCGLRQRRWPSMAWSAAGWSVHCLGFVLRWKWGKVLYFDESEEERIGLSHSVQLHST